MWVVLISAAALTAPLPGCIDHPATGPTAASQLSVEAELVQLRQRVGDLRTAVRMAGRLTPALEQELASITKGIETWQARSGRHDISFRQETHAHPVQAGGNGKPALAPRGGGGGTCTPCPLIIESIGGGLVCFLHYEGPCPRPGDIVGRICAYTCISLYVIS